MISVTVCNINDCNSLRINDVSLETDSRPALQCSDLHNEDNGGVGSPVTVSCQATEFR